MKKWAFIEESVVKIFVEQDTKPILEGTWVEVPSNLAGFGSNWKYIAGQFLPPDPPPKILTRLEYINKLGNSYNSIVSTAKTDVDVEVWLEKFRLNEEFNVSSAEGIADVQFLVTKNLITQQKANTILN